MTFQPWFDFDGQPIDVAAWGVLFESPERFVARDEIGMRLVSTVWLGLDHGFGMAPQPLIYETLVFRDDRADTEYLRRYATRAEAIAGHRETVLLVQLEQELGVDHE